MIKNINLGGTGHLAGSYEDEDGVQRGQVSDAPALGLAHHPRLCGGASPQVLYAAHCTLHTSVPITPHVMTKLLPPIFLFHLVQYFRFFFF